MQLRRVTTQDLDQNWFLYFNKEFPKKKKKKGQKRLDKSENEFIVLASSLKARHIALTFSRDWTCSLSEGRTLGVLAVTVPKATILSPWSKPYVNKAKCNQRFVLVPDLMTKKLIERKE